MPTDKQIEAAARAIVDRTQSSEDAIWQEDREVARAALTAADQAEDEQAVYTDPSGRVWHPHRGYWCYKTAWELKRAQDRIAELEDAAEQAEPIADAKPYAWEIIGAELHRLTFDEAEAREIASGFGGIVKPLYRENQTDASLTIPSCPNAGRYLAETNDGKLMYLNHANTWQGCPNFIANPAIAYPSVAEARKNAEAKTVSQVPVTVSGPYPDPRPEDCRFRLKDEGKPYPRSGCRYCGKNIVTGLGTSCLLTTREVIVGRKYRFTDVDNTEYEVTIIGFDPYEKQWVAASPNFSLGVGHLEADELASLVPLP